MTKSKVAYIEIAVVRFFIIILQLLFLKVYTYYTSLYELGIYYFLFTVSYSLNAFLLVPLDYFQQSNLYMLKEGNFSLKSFFSLNVKVLKFSGCILLLMFMACYIFDRSLFLTAFLVIMVALSTYFATLIRGLINNLEKRKQAIYCLLLESTVKILAFWLLIKVFPPSSTIILASLTLASLFGLTSLVFVLVKLKEYKAFGIYTFDYRKIFKFAYPISLGAVINWIQMQGYRMILVPLGLVEIVGIYGTVANVGSSGMSAYSAIFSQVFIPDLYKTNGKYIKKYVLNATLSIIAILIVGYIFSDFIVALLTKRNLEEYSSIIVFGILAEAGNFLIGAMTIFITIHNITKVSLKASVAGLVSFSTIFSLLYFTGSIGIYTVGVPIVITQFVICVYLYTIVRKQIYLTEKNG